MKRIVIILACLLSACLASAQATGERLPMKVYIEDLPQPFPSNAKVQLAGKLQQMLTQNGISSTDIYSDFLITAIANPLEKIVVPGAPAQILQEIDFSFYIVDANRQLVFASCSVTSKGVGQSETKSYMDAIKKVSVGNPEIAAFLSAGKKKIINYYDVEAENIFARTRQLAAAHKYEEALFYLCGFPTESANYMKSIEAGNDIYRQYLDYTAQKNLAKARSLWAADQSTAGANAAGAHLAEILPEASCYPEALALQTEIKSKIREEWEWEMKKYQDGVDLEKMKISAWQAVGIEFGKHQQPTTTNLAWLR